MTPGNKELLLASMRLAVVNLRTWQLEIETCGIIGLLAYLLVEPEREALR